MIPSPRQSWSTTPGILPDHALEQLLRRGAIAAPVPIDPIQIQPASLDLRLGPIAYRMPYSLLPSQSHWIDRHPTHDAVERLALTNGAVLQQGQIYLIPLLESLDLPYPIEGRANPKSTTGRVDLFCRLLTTGSAQFDTVPAGYHGPLYLEVFPRSFSVAVRAGLSLVQLRLQIGSTAWDDATIRTMHALTPLAYDPHTGAPLDAALHLHDGFICRVTLLPHHDIAAFRAKRQAPVLDLSARGTLDPTHYWEPLFPSHRHSLVLEPEAFYLLLSLERLSIPRAAAADIAPYELSLGELRTHYAGFFDPGFGTASDGLPGTPAVLEVRPHDVPYLIEHEQPLFKLRYASLQTPPQRLYGATIGSTYHRQTLTLSKPFQPWPQGS